MSSGRNPTVKSHEPYFAHQTPAFTQGSCDNPDNITIRSKISILIGECMIRMGKKWSVLLAALVFGLTIMVFTAVMVYSGRLLPRLGPKKTASIGALAYGLGFLVASY